MIKAVFADVDNTLLDFNKGAKQAIDEGFALFGLSLVPGVYEMFHRVNNDLWKRIESGTLTKDELHRIRWQTIFDALQIKGNGPEFEEYFRAYIRECSAPVDSAEQMLRYICKKYPIYVASNASLFQQKRRLEKANFLQYIQGIFTSEEAGVAKPERGFFDYCMRFVGNISPNQIMLIGDSPDADIKGAKRYGMQTCWFDYHKTGQKLPEADFVICDLSEIEHIL